MSADSSKTAEPPSKSLGPKVAWSAQSAVMATIGIFFIAQLLAAVFLSIGLAVGGFDEQGSRQWLDTIIGKSIYVFISDALILAAVWGYVRLQKGNLGQLGFGRSPAWRDAGMGVLGWLVYYGLLVVVLAIATALTPIDPNQQQELGFDKLFGSTEIILAFISLVVLPPLVEETLFRGFLFPGLRQKMSFWWATLITSALFAAPHLLATSSGLLWIAAVDTFVLSVVLCYVREKSGALWAPIVIHGIKNSIAFAGLVLGFAVL